jgi:iron complex outermembrane recepter protein
MCNRAGIILLATFASLLSFDSSPSWAGEPSAASPEVSSHYDLPAESLDKALRDFALQAKCNLSYEPSIVAGLQAPAISGNYKASHVLSLLLKGTKLRAANINDNTIQILERTPSTSRDSAPASNARAASGDVPAKGSKADIPLAVGSSSNSQAPSPSTNDPGNRGSKDIEEITVTGTHIRGTKDSPSPVQVFTRADIDATGTVTIQQFLQTLPENFGSASENTIGQIAASSQTNNTVNGSAPNLRGLGADATLVLVNGHRVAPGNSDGSFVDISMIPLTAVERIEIVTDGASAIYGSDAVGGVVNIILRSHFDGAESRVQYGSVSTGSMHDVQIGQTFGHDWSGGSAVLSYQYSDQTPLPASSRNYLQFLPLPFNIIPEQVQHAAFANVNQQLTSDVDLHGDFAYSHRSTASIFSAGDSTIGYSTTASPASIDGYSASLGSTLKLPRQSELRISGTYSESDTSQQTFQTPLPSPLQFVLKTKSAISSLDVNLDGLLASVPAGSVRYAVGAQYRRESFGNTYLFPATENTFYPSRDVEAGYVELHVPLAGPIDGGQDDPSLELTAADRGEHYSDFGSTNNPQIGLIWKPLPSTTIRTTYGTSFKAPLLSQLNPIPSQVIPIPGSLFNAAPGGTPNTLIINGGNPGLEPEKAKVWTVGIDFRPMEIPGFTSKLTYYDIAFRDQIAVAGASYCACNAFVDAAIFGPAVLQRNPSSALVQQLISNPTYANPFNVDPTTIGAIFDSRALNLSTVKTRGVDFGFEYKITLSDVQIDTGIDGTRILTFDNQFTGTAPVTSTLNTTYNPIDLRIRGRTVVTRGPLSAGAYLNFADGYTDTNITPNSHISSWTTADALVSYQLHDAGSAFDGFSISLSVRNLTNRDPPYVANPLGYQINYDGANANALGRFYSLQLQKRW